MGGNYMETSVDDELENWKPYGLVKPIPANLRNWLGMLDIMEGKGPIYMRTEEAIQKNRQAKFRMTRRAAKKKLKELEVRSLGRLPGYDHLAGSAVGLERTPSPRRESF